ncbi:MAG TPA: acyl-CoA dehydrogenase family protein [Nocardioides sp.]|uniref:acyl-CoA dehydrogenase family protein n=1 Tax=Nocardioides sp. TaxID=35761 RepID=UPI002C16C048|nr:acyl-CoA dehydrogenase family protein [Nocardioides sp.]HQR27780.1 acyl-CoA dehydrogenase family protein [Nocardioides sp.]
MEFQPSARSQEYAERLTRFMAEHVYPAEPVHAAQRAAAVAAGTPHAVPPVVEELKREARSQGLWNLFLPDCTDPAHGLSVLEYAPLAEITGRSAELAPEATNCAAPDTGNMEILHLFGSPGQKQRWLEPLLRGEIRSAFSMTEPEVASSDARNITASIVRDGDEYVINGHKWWSTGANDPRCQVLVVMGKTDPTADTYHQQSMVLVPVDAPGVEVVRSTQVFGYTDQHGHTEITYTDVRVPVTNLLGAEGSGFAIAQARLGPGRIHHCMRAIGMAERALDLLCDRALTRTAFGKELARQGVIQTWIAESRLAIDQARLLTLDAAWKIDTVGAKGARKEIAAVKVVAPRMALDVVDRAIQAYGAAGVSEDTPLAQMWAGLRSLRIADGPDEVHLRDVARLELRDRMARLAGADRA